MLLAGLLLLSGCTIMHTSTQTFKEDGTSEIVIDHQFALPQNDITQIKSLVNVMLPTITSTNYRLMERVIQRSGEAYASAICAEMKGASCTVGPDNKIHVVGSLDAGNGFYSMTVVNDTTNASAPKQIRTYEIRKIPTIYYFAAKGKTSDEFGLGVVKSFTKHFRDTLPADLDSIITTNYYCLGISPYGCDVVSNNGNNINVRLIGSGGGLMPAAKLVWAGCSARNVSDISDMNETEAAAVVSRKMAIGKTPNVTGLELSLSCPSNETKTLVVAATPVSSYAARANITIAPTVYTYMLLDKQSMKAQAVQLLDTLEKNATASAINNTPIGPIELDALNINLETGMFGNSTTLEEMQDGITKTQSQLESANITIDAELSYAASFPGTVTSVVGGSGTSIAISNNGFKVTLADLVRMGKGKIVVKTEKPLPVPANESNGKIFGLDPVVLFGGAIVVVVLLALLVWFLGRKPKEPANLNTVPPTTYAGQQPPQQPQM